MEDSFRAPWTPCGPRMVPLDVDVDVIGERMKNAARKRIGEEIHSPNSMYP